MTLKIYYANNGYIEKYFNYLGMDTGIYFVRCCRHSLTEGIQSYLQPVKVLSDLRISGSVRIHLPLSGLSLTWPRPSRRPSVCQDRDRPEVATPRRGYLDRALPPTPPFRLHPLQGLVAHRPTQSARSKLSLSGRTRNSGQRGFRGKTPLIREPVHGP